MDFIERILGLSPDGGTGATECMLLLIPIVVVGLVAVRRYTRGTLSSRESGAATPSVKNRS